MRAWQGRDQLRQPYQIVGGEREGERPIDLRQAAQPGLAQTGHGLQPAERVFDAFADALACAVPGCRVVRRSIAERRPQVFWAT